MKGIMISFMEEVVSEEGSSSRVKKEEKKLPM